MTNDVTKNSSEEEMDPLIPIIVITVVVILIIIITIVCVKLAKRKRVVVVDEDKVIQARMAQITLETTRKLKP